MEKKKYHGPKYDLRLILLILRFLQLLSEFHMLFIITAKNKAYENISFYHL